jgi:hypothetical protein
MCSAMNLDDWCVANPNRARKLQAKLGKVQLGRYRSGERIPRPEPMGVIVAATDGQVMPNDFYVDVIPPRYRHLAATMMAAE